MQFHPEKSSAAGLRLLANFARICIAAAAAAARSARPVRLYPAIDILGGNAVRLVTGDFDAKKVYDEDPLSAARGWVAGGRASTCTWSTSTAPRRGEPVNLEQLRRIAGEAGVPVQYGGGLRSAHAVDGRARRRAQSA